MFKPSEEKSSKTHELINRVFSEKVGEGHNYMVAYAYYMKSGLFSKKMFSYVVGFNNDSKSIVIIPLDSNGNSGEAVVLNKENILSAKKGMQGDVTIKTNTAGGDFRFIVPGYTPASLESAYILPVIQEQQAIKFLELIKNY